MDAEEVKAKYRERTCPITRNNCTTDSCAWWYDDTEYDGAVGCSIVIIADSVHEEAFGEDTPIKMAEDNGG